MTGSRCFGRLWLLALKIRQVVTAETGVGIVSLRKAEETSKVSWVSVSWARVNFFWCTHKDLTVRHEAVQQHSLKRASVKKISITASIILSDWWICRIIALEHSFVVNLHWSISPDHVYGSLWLPLSMQLEESYMMHSSLWKIQRICKSTCAALWWEQAFAPSEIAVHGQLWPHPTSSGSRNSYLVCGMKHLGLLSLDSPSDSHTE